MLDDPEIRHVLSRSSSQMLGLLGMCLMASKRVPVSVATRFGGTMWCARCKSLVIIGRLPWSRSFRGLCHECGLEVIRAA